MAPLRIMYLGGGWGDAIHYLDDSRKRIYGFKDRMTNSFCDGSVLFDLINHRYDDTVPLYLITNIERCRDPEDMFFADIFLIGRVKNPQNDYPQYWFKPYCKDLIQEYKKKLYKPFSRHKGRNKKILRILKLMSK